MWLVWIVPIVIFMFYGQRIQLQITSSEISKSLEKLKTYKEETKKELVDYIKTTLKPSADPSQKIDRFFEHFTIMPVDMDPNGIVQKVRHITRSREDYIRLQVKMLSPDISGLEASKIENILEVATTLHLIYKIV